MRSYEADNIPTCENCGARFDEPIANFVVPGSVERKSEDVCPVCDKRFTVYRSPQGRYISEML